MFPITRKQREAVWKKFRVDNPQWVSPGTQKVRDYFAPDLIYETKVSTAKWRAFRRRVKPTIGCDGAIALPWAGMVLCIETNGHTHS
jgi:hypothetical protein